ncbi:MAG TPA: HemK2/MTQ2 family protein methyltransferase, partial [Thermoplasmata archaeon]|nr:HemK2/MTQ2 family protein methyltransferase [Thermoplasmata archaeon]
MPRRRREASGAVYPVREDSRLLARFARPRRGERVLEVGCGRGVATLASARRGARLVVATDLNPAAVRAVLRRARNESLPVEAVRTDLAAGLRRFDLILSNPPYLPTTARQRDRDPWENLALDGGLDGCRVTARLIAELPHHLAPRGRAYLVISSLQSRERLNEIRRRWLRGDGDCSTVARQRWGKETLSVWRLSRG